MEKWWFNSIFHNKELEHRCELTKSMCSFGPIGHTSENEDPVLLVLNDIDKRISSSSDSTSFYRSNVDHLFDIKDIWSLISDDTFLVKDSNGDCYFVYLDIENSIFEIDNSSSFINELESAFDNYLNSNEFFIR